MTDFSGALGRRTVIRSLGAFAATGALTACAPGAVGNLGGGGSVQVALLAPSSAGDGNVAFLAQNLINAAQLAARDLEGAEVDLRIYDTAGNTERAGQVAQQAIDEGADVIAGPLFAQSANAAGLVAAPRGIPVLSFSNTPTIAGGNVFVMGPTFENTARRILGFAQGGGRTRVFVFHGENEAERLGRDAIVRAARDFGMTIAGTSGFAMSQDGIISAVPDAVQQIDSSGADLLFLTSNTDTALPFVAQLLPENGMPPSRIQYAGLTRWDVPASAMSLPGVQGGWFAVPDPAAVSSFGNRYSAAYGQPPHSIAGLGYDAIAAVGALVGSGQRVTPATLTQARGFAGANGAFRFLSNGTNQRALAIATVENGGLRILDPAPSGFASAGA